MMSVPCGDCDEMDCNACDYQSLMDKEYEYKWHDLRKNQEDLPEPLSLCVICVKRWSKITDDWIIGDYKLTEFTDGFEYAKGWYGLPEPEVLAWRYIEPFEPFTEEL